MTEWNRQQLWPDRRGSQLVTAWGALAWLGAVGLLFYSCHDLYVVEDDIRTHVDHASECIEDQDCVLTPSILTCCGECDPAPPFEALPRARLEEQRATLAERCAPVTRLCEPPTCAPVPAECRARAECRAGVCQAVANTKCLYR